MGAWVTHDLSAFLSDGDLFGGSNRVGWDGTYLHRISGSQARFTLPDITLSPTDVTEVEITFGAAGNGGTPSSFNHLLLIALDALSGATFDDFATLGDTIEPFDGTTTTPDDLVYTLTFGPGVYAPTDPGESTNGWQTHFDTYVATGDRPYLLFRVTDASTQVAQIRTRIVTHDPTEPVDSPIPTGAGGRPPLDGGGPTSPVAGGDSPQDAPAGGGYQTPAVRRQSPTTPQIVIDGHWLTPAAPWGDLSYSHVWPGGSGNASWTAEQVPARLRKRGLTFELRMGAEVIFGGLTTEPDPSGVTMDAVGLWTIGEGWTALDGSGDSTTVPDDAIDAAITQGMPWKRRDSISTSAVDIDTSQGPVTIGALLDAYALSQTQRWGVTPDGYVLCIDDPADPKWHVLPLDGGLTPADDFATRLIGRYYNGSAYVTVSVTDDPGNNGIREAIVDLTVYGTLTSTKATHRLHSLLDLGLSRPSWAEPIICGYGDILSPGAVPVGLERPVAGDLVRVHGHIDETQTRGGRMWTDVLIGQSELSDDTLTLAPMGMPARTLVDVLALAAQSNTNNRRQ